MWKQTKIILTFFYLFSMILMGCQQNHIEMGSPTDAKPVSHEQWTQLLQKHVSSSGKVSYTGFKKDLQKLEGYLDLLRSAHPHQSWSESQRLAYWINAYNAFTVKLILDHAPVKSIKDIGGVLSSPWNIKFIEIEGKKYDLNDLEHNIIRKRFNEPRIHFAVNCASFSCPKLLNKAYTAEELENQLETQAKAFVNDPERNKITASKIEISEIFKWFREDFTKKGSLIGFLNQYTNTPINADATVGYLDYNWNLND